MPLTEEMKSFLTPGHPPTNLSEALVLGLLGDSVRVFHRCGVANTTGTQADLWILGANMDYPTAATIATCYSGSGDDTSAGDGARQLEVIGWDENWELHTETVSLNGTTPVTTTEKFWRVITARVVAAGSAGRNAGVLTCEIDGKDAAKVFPTNNANLDPHFTVPPGHIGYLFDWRVSAVTGGGQIAYGGVKLMLRPKDEPFYAYDEHFLGAQREGFGPFVAVAPETDITIRSWSEGGGGSRWVSSGYKIAVLPAAT